MITSKKASRTGKQAMASVKEGARAINRNSKLVLSARDIIHTRMSNPEASELLRMVPEKMIAFGAAGMLLCQHAMEIGVRFGPSAPGSLGLLTAKNPWQFWERYVGRSMVLGTALLKAQGSILEPMLNALTRNQTRLSS